MKVNKEIDKLIADKLRKGVNSLPPQEFTEGSWENFKVANAAHIRAVRRTRTIRIYRYSAIGAAAMLLIGIFLFTSDNQFFKVSESSLSNPIAVIENPALIVGTAKESNILTAQEASALTAKERTVVTATSTEAAALIEKEATTLIAKEATAITTKEASALTEKEAIELIANERLATKNNNRVFQSDSKEFDKKPLRFGVNISPGFNSTSTNSGNSLNYSGGVTMDISIAKNLQISTGVQIEHNNVGAESQVRTMGVEPGHIDAVLTNLDIPLNITWHFFSDKNTSYYISGGFSSLAYLNEKYTTTSYSHQIKANTVAQSGDEQLTTYRIENVESVKTTTISSPNTLDVAGRVNLIFGYEQKLSPKLNLHIEPFIKIPLTGLASENMRFTTGGVTFKVSF